MAASQSKILNTQTWVKGLGLGFRSVTTAAHARDLGLGHVKGFTGPYYALWSRLDKTYIAIATTPKN